MTYNNLYTFTDPGSGAEIKGEAFASKRIGEQLWVAVSVEGVNWALPLGWPNNAQPICEEISPEEYGEIFDGPVNNLPEVWKVEIWEDC